MNRQIKCKRVSQILVLAMLLLRLDADTDIARERVYEIASRVANWQISTFESQGAYRALPAKRESWRTRDKHHDLDWTNAALYVGMFQWGLASGSSHYNDWLTTIADRNDWNLHERKYHADDHTVGQLYLNLYENGVEGSTILPIRERFDWILKNRRMGTLKWEANPTDAHHRWGWCDALFMAPPVWARLSKITGDQKYLAFMNEEYRATYDLLWDEDESLFWRDSSYFDRREKNGRKVFWSRGNGWVFGGLALMIPDLPDDWEDREFYVELFQKMAVKIRDIQRPDGTWSMGLLGNQHDYPDIETSGSSFFTFGLAWGINNGFLDSEIYRPVVLKAWRALEQCVHEDGKLGWVQPIGGAPGESYENYSEVYGVGAFLAASSEVYNMLRKQASVKDPNL